MKYPYFDRFFDRSRCILLVDICMYDIYIYTKFHFKFLNKIKSDEQKCRGCFGNIGLVVITPANPIKNLLKTVESNSYFNLNPMPASEVVILLNKV